MIRVQVLADSPLARAGIEAMLRSHPSIELVPEEADVTLLQSDEPPDELPGALPHGLPDGMPPSDAPVVLITSLADPHAAAAALRLGIRGLLPPDATTQEIVAAIEAAAAGLVVLPASELESLLPQHGTRSASTESLTPRELEVLRMLAEGHSNKEIAFRLGVSEHTVKFHVAAVLAKLGASTRTEAVMLGIRQGFVLI